MAKELFDCPIGCGRRHQEGHPHLNAEPRSNVSTVDASSAPISVTGADSPETLSAQARTAVAAETKRMPQVKSKVEREEEEKAARVTAMRPLARQLSTVPYKAIAFATVDERWMKMAEEEIAALEAATLTAMLAWGIDFSGKWSSVSVLVLCHAQIIAMKAKAIYEEDKKKKAASNAVTQNTSDKKPEPVQ